MAGTAAKIIPESVVNGEDTKEPPKEESAKLESKLEAPTAEEVMKQADEKEGTRGKAEEEAKPAITESLDPIESEKLKEVAEEKTAEDEKKEDVVEEAGAEVKVAEEPKPMDTETGEAKEAPKETAVETEKEELEDEKKEGEAEEMNAEEETKSKRTRQKKEKAMVSPPISTRPQRERKSAERFAVEDSRDKVADIEIKQGKGTPLKDIPNVVSKLGKRTRNDEILTMLHSLLYSKRAKAHVLKKNILEFSGFVWGDNEARERAKVKEKLSRYTKEGLLQLLDILDLPTGGKKDDQIERVLDFLQEPSDRSEEASKKRKISGKTPPKDKKTPKSVGKSKKEEEEEEEEEEAAAAKKQKTPAKSPAASPAGKRKAPPTEANLRKKIKEILTDADGKVMTNTRVIETLGEYFSGDLEKKKDLISKLVTEALPPAEGEASLPEDTPLDKAAEERPTEEPPTAMEVETKVEEETDAGANEEKMEEGKTTTEEAKVEKLTEETKGEVKEEMGDEKAGAEDAKDEEKESEKPGEEAAKVEKTEPPAAPETAEGVEKPKEEKSKEQYEEEAKTKEAAAEAMAEKTETAIVEAPTGDKMEVDPEQQVKSATAETATSAEGAGETA